MLRVNWIEINEKDEGRAKRTDDWVDLESLEVLNQVAWLYFYSMNKDKFPELPKDKFKQFSIGCVYNIRWECHPIFIICADLELSFTAFDKTMKVFDVLWMILNVFALQ